MAWELTQMMDVGTSNPIVARMGNGLSEIIEMARISKEKKEVIHLCCFEIMKALVEAEKTSKPLLEEIKKIEEQIQTQGIKTQSNGRVIETPGVLSLENTRVFLKFAKQALQQLAKAMGVILDHNFNGPHFHKVLLHVKQTFGDQHPVSKLLEEDHVWIKEIIDLRDEDEHPKSDKSFVRGFKISHLPDGKFLVDGPRFFNDIPISNRLEVYAHNLLTFSEEMIALSLEYFFPKIVTVYDIPENLRNSANPVRFRVGLKESANFPNPPTSPA